MESKEFQIHVQDLYFQFILDGSKNVEGRIFKGKFLKMKAGDTLNINEKLIKKIKYIKFYYTFEEMLIMEGVLNTIPNAGSLNDAINAYYQFYSEIEEKEYGVCALKLEE
jgi:ASC-1-like (ASCH) protein